MATFNGTYRDDYITGTASSDTMSGNGGNDRLFGEGGNDTLYGGFGNDWLYGGDGDDIIYGGHGNGFLYGNDGDDVFVDLNDSGAHRYNGGDGHDRIELRYTRYDYKDGYSLEIASLSNIEEIVNKLPSSYLPHNIVVESSFMDFSEVTITNFDAIVGNGDRNFIKGSNLHGNTIDGLGGNDTLKGGQFADTLLGDDGDDKLVGSAGDDTLKGGAGADTFEFEVGDGSDVIEDWQDGTDILDFSNSGLSFSDIAISADSDGAALIQYGVVDEILIENASGLIDAADFLF